MPNKIKSFTATENPSIAALTEIDPAVIQKLPANYAGTNDSPALANLFVNALNKVDTYAALNTVNTDLIPDGMTRGNPKKFAVAYLRYIKDSTDFGLYYDFQQVFKSDTLSDEHIFYALTLIQTYGNRTRNGILNTLNSIYAYEQNLEPKKKREPISIESLNNLFALANVLRSEGVQIPIDNLWVCSTHWTAPEVIEMIAEGLELRKAVELYTLGFTTMEEILNYGQDLPDSWLDRILNGAPKKKH